MSNYLSDLEIANAAKKKPISDIANSININEEDLIKYGNDKAKLSYDFINSLSKEKDGRLILVTAISPTPAGEGKTTTSVGLVDGLCHIGKKAMICLREPSLGPCFGMKGGAAGGGYAQVIPMTDINLHFTGDFHAIGAAHNLLSALIDNHIHWDNELNIDPRRITWKRVVDMNDRSLREITCGLGGLGNGIPRQSGYDITVASEIMAVFCLASDLEDLQNRIGNIVIGYTKDKKPVRAKQLNADGAVTALLKDAFQPNLVQTLENNPAFMHGGPFANIAHGCNSVIATKTALKLSDYVVTEAGFGADLGAEKFLNIKCRKAGLVPSCVVIVATIRALKMHGGVEKEDLKKEDVEALKRGLVNLERHIENIKKFGLEPIVAINHFVLDTKSEINTILKFCKQKRVQVSECKHWAKGGNGATDLAKKVVLACNKRKNKFSFLYKDNLKLWDKIEIIAKQIYKASKITANDEVKNQLRNFEKNGHKHLPVCIAKTQYSFSTDPKNKGAPSNHEIPIREVRLSSGAEFVVVVCGSVMTMPGLPKVPAADNIKLNKKGEVDGLF